MLQSVRVRVSSRPDYRLKAAFKTRHRVGSFLFLELRRPKKILLKLQRCYSRRPRILLLLLQSFIFNTILFSRAARLGIVLGPFGEVMAQNQLPEGAVPFTFDDAGN